MSLPSEPHYEIPSAELAAWIDQQGSERWWNVDGDLLLTGRLSFPCPGDELAEELRRINRSLLILTCKGNADAQGQVIGMERLDALVDHLGENVVIAGPKPSWVNDRVLLLRWKADRENWLLIEDESTKRNQQDIAAGAGEK
jgi:hypothetical protein